MHYDSFNISYVIFGLAGILWGFIFSLVLNRYMLVAYSKPKEHSIPISRLAQIGKSFLGWKGILVLLALSLVYIIGNEVSIKYFRTHPNKRFEIHCASAKGNIDNVRKLLDEGVDVDSKGEWNFTPLHLASDCGHLNIVQLLLKKKATVDSKDWQNCTPLFMASQSGHLEVAQLLIEKGAIVDAQSISNNTPLFEAVSNAKKDVAEMLIKKGANVNKRNRSGDTPFHELLNNRSGSKEHKEHVKTLDLLIHSGARIDIKGAFGATPLIIACNNAWENAVSILIGKGANVNAKDNSGETPLHKAAFEQNISIINLLIESGANINALDNSGGTPFDQLYTTTCRTETINVMLSYGAKRGADLRKEVGKKK